MLTPSYARCAACVANEPPRAVRFPRTVPAAAPAPASWRPYPEASPDQRRQAMFLARQILQAAYPFLAEWQWVQALEELRLPLHCTVEEATLSRDGLTTLVRYLAAYYPTVPVAGPAGAPAPAPTPMPIPTPIPTPTPTDPPARELRVKQTCDIRASLMEQLERVCYWRRKSRTWFVNQALDQLLRQCPEALTPLPEE